MQMSPTTFATRAAHFHAAADTARQAGDVAGAATATAFAVRCEHAATTGTLLAEPSDLTYGSDDCCLSRGEHLSDPHAPGCPQVDIDLGGDEDRR